MSGKIKMAFSEVHADENLKIQTLDKILKKPTKNISVVSYTMKFAPVMAMVVFLIVGKFYMTPVSYISVDINPSIELEVNGFGKVIKVIANNHDAQQIIESVHLKNLNYIEALETLVYAESFVEYTDSYTEITVIGANEEVSDSMIEHITACSFSGDHVTCFSENEALREEAEQYDISFGKYRAYLELLELNPMIHISDIQNLPMAVIRDMIEQGGEIDESESKNFYESNYQMNHDNCASDEHHGNGQGQQNGKGQN